MFYLILQKSNLHDNPEVLFKELSEEMNKCVINEQMHQKGKIVQLNVYFEVSVQIETPHSIADQEYVYRNSNWFYELRNLKFLVRLLIWYSVSKIRIHYLLPAQNLILIELI